MLKIVSPKAELNVLRGMCSKQKKISGALLSSVDNSYFFSEESVEVYNAIRKHMQEEGEAPSYRILIEDPDLSEEARTHLRSSEAVVQTTADAEKAARILNKYRQRRGMYNLAAHINAQMQGSSLDIDGLLEETATAFNVIRSKKSTADSFLHFGRNNNSKDVVEDILYGDHTEDVIPTGLKAFDDVSGGFLRGSMISIGAS